MLFPDYYNVFRRDRIGKRGGGVLIAVKNIFVTKQIEYFICDSECVWIEVNDSKGNKYIIGNTYMPPNCDIQNFNDYFDKIIQNYDNKTNRLLIFGDFNVPEIKWNEISYTDWNVCSTSNKMNKIFEMMNTLNISQINTHNNSHNNILDLIFLNTDSIKLVGINHNMNPLVKPDKFHPPLSLNISINRPYALITEDDTMKYCFDKGNYLGLVFSSRDTDWSSVITESSVDMAVDKFTSIINSQIKTFIPKKKKKNLKYPSWYSKHLISLIKYKLIWHKKSKVKNKPIYYCIFTAIRKLTKACINYDYLKYIDSIQNDISSNPKKLWNYIKKNNRVSKHCNQHEYIYEDSKSETPCEIANMFAKYFESTFKKSKNGNTPDCVEMQDQRLSINEISESEVIEALKTVRPSRTLGPDGIPPFLIKGLGSFLIPAITYIFNLILKEKTFPALWKISYIIPIHKSGKKEIINNYRPIAIQCSLAKLFEKIISKNIYSYMSSLLIENQHGFVKGRSIDTNLVTFTEVITESLRSQKQIDTIYIDFSKAFDSLDHNILLYKIRNYGFGNNLVSLITSYLTFRKCCVSHLGAKSRYFTPTSGVPQGSVLGPLLFLIFINDIGSCFVNTEFLLYADDLKIYKQINSEVDRTLMQNDLKKLCIWCTENKMQINISKTNIISFSNRRNNKIYDYFLDDIKLLRCESIKDLGVYFTSKFKFNEHVDKMVNNAASALGRLKHLCRDFNKLEVILNLYKALVYSKLEFGSLIWDPWQQILIDKCESINKKFIRFLNFKFRNLNLYDVSYRERLDFLNLKELQNRRKSKQINFIEKILNKNIDCPQLTKKLHFKTPVYPLRRNEIFHTETMKNNYTSPINSMMKQYNQHFCT